MRNSHYATIEGRVLARAIKSVSPVVEHWSTYPTLSCIHLKVEGGTLTVTGSNLDVEISIPVDLNDASGDWSSLVSPRVLVKLAAMAGRDLLRLSPGEDALHIDQDGVLDFDLPALGVDNFPWIAGERKTLLEGFDAGVLPSLLRKVVDFVSTEETRYYLNGVAWQFDAKGRRFVGTDGHRLGVTRYSSEPMAEASRIIPQAAVQLLLDCDAAIAAWEVAPLVLEFDAGKRRIRTKLIDGTFPEVDRVIPKERVGDLAIGRDVLVQAATRALALSVRRYEGHALRFEPEGERTVVRAKHADFGTGTVGLRAKWPEGVEPFAVNGAYLKSVLATCSGEVRLGATSNKGGPLVIADVDETMIRLLMPMRAD